MNVIIDFVLWFQHENTTNENTTNENTTPFGLYFVVETIWATRKYKNQKHERLSEREAKSNFNFSYAAGVFRWNLKMKQQSSIMLLQDLLCISNSYLERFHNLFALSLCKRNINQNNQNATIHLQLQCQRQQYDQDHHF